MKKTFGLVGVPTFGEVSIEWAINKSHLSVGLAVYVIDMFIKDKRVDVAKNELCQTALDNNCDWVFLLDDDVLPPTETIMKMIKLWRDRDDCKIINGVYWSKSNPPVPLMFRDHMRGSYMNWHVGDLVEVDSAGAGCTFIDTEVLKKLEKPWFNVDYTYRSPEVENQPSGPDMATTEDLYFYKKARDAGYKVWVDTSLQCQHLDKNSGLAFGIRPDMPQFQAGVPILKKGKKLILDIGSGFDTPHYLQDLGQVTTLDMNEICNPSIVADWRNIPVQDQFFDIVHSSHCLEHTYFRESLNVLKEWQRVLKIGGELHLKVPNLQWAAKRIMDGTMEKGNREEAERVMFVLYSAQLNHEDTHKSGYTPELLKKLLEQSRAFKGIKVWTEDKDGHYNIYARAKKVKHIHFESIYEDFEGKYDNKLRKVKDAVQVQNKV